ncbi:PKD domain-containing protein [Halalkaliarchaeum sp. AArc-GB]|uniref:PKD domain-containing protein n=1 Tax=Halalkaliarchaeum sp. AArc-GB TaxID=3074078 RepID=UPI002857EED8|nr:PKD domain-containing protein [Halalkaliarchaeum sp. AArc-GB]MDR5672979.1 PKD domain-containing protein [Halalkaliarchaeum sp. AArc-GB]
MDGRKVFAVLLVVAAVSSTAVVVADETGPMADAGLDRSVDLGETVYLDASGSRSVSGDIDGFQWYVTPPDGERERLEAGDSARHTYVPDSAGKWRFTVEVTGTNEEVSEDYVEILVEVADSSEDEPRQSDDGPDDSDETDSTSEDTSSNPDGGSGSDPTPTPTPTSDEPEETTESDETDQDTIELEISGPSVVVQGTEHTYEVESSGEITEYDWEYTSGQDIYLGSGTTQDISFSDQKADSGKITVLGTTNFGDEVLDKKAVTIVESDAETQEVADEPEHEINNLNGRLLVGDEELVFSSNDVFDDSVPRFYLRSEEETVEFVADVDSEDDIDLTYRWNFGDGTTTVSSQPQVEHVYIFEDKGVHEFDVSVTVVDQYGREQSESDTARILGKDESNSDYSFEIKSKDDEYLTATFEITTPSRTNDVIPDEQKEVLEAHFGDGNSLNVLPSECGDCGEKRTQVTHRYDSPGEYTAWLSTGKLTNSGEDIRETVTFDSYTEYHYTERTTAVAEYVSEDDPGEGWEKAGIESIDEEVVDREETRIRDEQNPDALLSDDWRRIGTETETEQRRETRVAANWPGSDWSMADRSVDSETRIVGYDYVEVPHRSLAPNDGTYVGTTTNYHTTTERERSTSRPSGSGWSRVRSTGQVRDGTGSTWRSSRRAPAAGWRVVDSRTVTDYYTETERYCKERTNSWFGNGRCIDWGERTVWKSDTSREYKFEYPTYSTEYLWERTTSTPEVYYEYRVPEYGQQDLHRWERTYTDEVEYGVYEKLEYETTTTYEWEKEVEREVEQVSLTPPNTDEVNVIGDVSERVVACGSGDGELEDEGCS